MSEGAVELAGRVALVTGASRGIGRAIALELARAGADVGVISTTAEGAGRTAEAVRALGRRALGLACDVADATAVTEAVKSLVAEMGGLDVLVHNAGITRDGLLARMSGEDWERVMDVNLKGAFHLVRSAVRHLIRSPAGRLVTISSVVGLTGNAGQANYAASKAGLVGFTRSVARELASRGVTANVVAPGLVETDMSAAMPEEARRRMLEAVPLGRAGTPEDVAAAVRFLAGPSGAYVTGQVLQVDGGLGM
jgi:3-oxoacyl-[acyl-carrier protein] reductase